MIIHDLEAELRLAEKKEGALASLLQDGKISRETFDLMEKKTGNITSALNALRKVLSEEPSAAGTNSSEEIRILESLLIDFKLSHLLGEIGEEDWRQKKDIIDTGLDSLRGIEPIIVKGELMPAPPTKLLDEREFEEDNIADTEPEKKEASFKEPPEEKKIRKTKKVAKTGKPRQKPQQQIETEPPTTRAATSGFHCMNPWNPKCKNTNIELSIYYKGQLTPICHSCWGEISKKNIEWSGL